jgi:hypothetical protein
MTPHLGRSAAERPSAGLRSAGSASRWTLRRSRDECRSSSVVVSRMWGGLPRMTRSIGDCETEHWNRHSFCDEGSGQ